jgi:predicted flap endonuclease-1-like 5' DNA nuclease
MSNPFDSILDSQKKAFDYWTDFSKKAATSFAANGRKAADTPATLLQEYYEFQKSFFEEMSKVGDPKEIFAKSPERFKNWVDVQTEFAERWLKLYKENAEGYGAKIPQWDMLSNPMKGFDSGFNGGLNDLNGFIKKSSDWLRDNVIEKMPPQMQAYYKDFSASYSDLHKYWESFTKMMQYGITQKDIIEKYFSPDAYKTFVDKFMGFKSFGDTNELLDNANSYFEQMIANVSKFAPNATNVNEAWKKTAEQLASNNFSPLFKNAMDMSSQLQHELAPIFNIMGEGKEVKIARLLKDIQFAYVAYVVKSSDMQTKVYQAGSVALPSILKTFSEKYTKTQDLPEYKAFYSAYINELEKHILTVLESSDYSILQNEVAKAGIAVKSKHDELIELMFSDLPFMMKSQADDIALENSTLRKKLRSLEERISSLEESSTATPVAKEAASNDAVAEDVPAAATEITQDDLKRIEGIGPKIEGLLLENGIKTFTELSKANVEFIKTLLETAGPRFRKLDPTTWVEQAVLAAKGDWSQLQKWQDEQKAGKAAK